MKLPPSRDGPAVKRRALLATLATATSGCAGLGGDATTQRTIDQGSSSGTSDATAETRTTTSEPAAATEEPSEDAPSGRDWPHDADPVASYGVAMDADVAYPDVVADWRLSAWNDADRARTFRTVASTSDGRVLDETTDVPADAWYRVDFPQVVPYDVRVAVDGETRWTRSVARADYACGAWDTSVAFNERTAGVVAEARTAEGCPRVGRMSTVDATAECVTDPAHDANVSFWNDNVVIDGRVATPDPCFSLFHDGPVYDFGARTLRVTIVGTPTPTDDCESCRSEHAYEFGVPVDAAYPDTVVVAHTVDVGDRYETTVVERAHPPDAA